MSGSDRILYVIQGIPGSNAPTKHAFAIADLFFMCGYEPHFMVAGIVDPRLPVLNEEFEYPVEFPKGLTLSGSQLAAKYAERLVSYASITAFKVAMTRVKPAVVVYYGVQNRLAKAIERECRSAGIPVLVDETDWFETHFDGDLAKWIVAKSRERRVTDADEAVDGVIAISPFFKEHFERVKKAQRTPHVMFLPPLNRPGDALCEVPLPEAAKRKSTRFFYAGSPAGKDFIDCFVEAMACCAGSLETVPELDIVGLNQKEGEDMLRGRSAGIAVRFHGRLPHAKVIEMLRRSDFGILFRKPALYARAGFSTKFAECMSNGVPMLCNAVGGADLVLSPDVDGIVVSDLEPTSLVEGIRSACYMSDSELLGMKRAALAKSKELFQPENYVATMTGFLGDLREACRR